jgi:hypothetical protein
VSVHVISWVLRNSEARLGDRLVLIALADHAKEDGTSAWPSVSTLASEAHLSEKQVQRCLAALKRDGRITETGKSKSGTRVYTVNMSEGQIVPPTNPSQNGDRMSPEPSLKQPSDNTLAAAPRVSRNHPMWDPIWDKLTEGFGPATTKDAQSRRAKAVKALVEAGATPEDVIVRGKRWRRHFPGATLTQEALVKWWDTLPRKELR